MNIAFLIMSVAKKLKYDLNQALQDFDITAQQFAVLQNIDRLSKTQIVTAKELIPLLDMDKPTISGIISRLISKNMVQKEQNPLDKRSFGLILTKKGEQTLASCYNIADTILDEHLTQITEEESRVLRGILTKLYNEREAK